MEEKIKYEELKEILQGIQKTIEMYNSLNPEEKLTVTRQEEKKDISDVFVCVYNENCVGLFKKINWNSKMVVGSPPAYDAGSIYVGVESDYIGMKKTHSDIICVSRWEPAGTKVVVDGKSYLANCNMKNGMSFDDMRLNMYGDGQIGSYEIGKASSQEMLDVLSYATRYYQLGNQKRK